MRTWTRTSSDSFSRPLARVPIACPKAPLERAGEPPCLITPAGVKCGDRRRGGGEGGVQSHRAADEKWWGVQVSVRAVESSCAHMRAASPASFPVPTSLRSPGRKKDRDIAQSHDSIFCCMRTQQRHEQRRGHAAYLQIAAEHSQQLVPVVIRVYEGLIEVQDRKTSRLLSSQPITKTGCGKKAKMELSFGQRSAYPDCIAEPLRLWREAAAGFPQLLIQAALGRGDQVLVLVGGEGIDGELLLDAVAKLLPDLLELEADLFKLEGNVLGPVLGRCAARR